MRVRPIFVVALLIVIVAGILVLALRGGESRSELISAAEQKALNAQFAAGRPYLPATIAAIDSLKLRQGIRRLTAGCPSGYMRCYFLPQTPRVVAPELAGLLRSIGANTRRTVPPFRGLVEGCTRKPDEALKVLTCTDMALLDHNEVAVLLGPVLDCGHDAVQCRFSGHTEILFTIPAMNPQ